MRWRYMLAMIVTVLAALWAAAGSVDTSLS
jgi:hypothetical protein